MGIPLLDINISDANLMCVGHIGSFRHNLAILIRH